MAATEIQEPRTYGNWRKPTSAGILGLGTIGTALLLVGLVVVVLTALIGGLLKAVVLAAVLAVLMVAVLSKDRHGRNVVSRASARGAWWWARSQRTNVYRSGPLGRSLWGTFQLPGLAASTRLSEHEDSYGRLFGMLYTPATSSYSVVIGTEPDGAALVDEEQIDAWVADWGHWLANLGDEPGIESASVTIETAPDTGTRLHREVMHNLDPDAPAFAQAMLEQVVDAYPSGSSTEPSPKSGCWNYSGARQTLRILRVSYRRRALRSNVWYWLLRIASRHRVMRATGPGSGTTAPQRSR